MRRYVLRLAIAFAFLATFGVVAEASLFTYNFKGLVDGSQASEAQPGASFSGTLTFDISGAAQPSSSNPSLFSLPAQITGQVGDFSFHDVLSGGAVIFSQNTIFFDTFGGTIGTGSTVFNNNMDVVLTGSDLFSAVPGSLPDLQNVKWENATAGTFDFNLPGYNPPQLTSIHGGFTAIDFNGGGGDAAPVPEPAGVTNLGFGLLSWGFLWRRKRIKKKEA